MYIDDTKCRGCLNCVRSFPDLFETRRGFSGEEVRIKDNVDQEEIIEASKVCPNGAIVE